SPDSARALLDLALGFAVAGLLSSAYQLATHEPPGFHLLHGERRRALAAVAFLLFAAPFIIVRRTVQGGGHRAGRFGFAAMAALVAGFWSLMSGTIVAMALDALEPFWF